MVGTGALRTLEDFHEAYATLFHVHHVLRRDSGIDVDAAGSTQK